MSGSFQADDMNYLFSALQELGRGTMGVINANPAYSDNEILKLHANGVRGIRFNVFRG